MAPTHGLTLGKYAPLHKGHQLIIETALMEMEFLSVIIYFAPEAVVPLQVRASWLKHLYPQIRVIEAPDGPTEVGYTEEIKRKHEDYIINKLGIRGITHFYSSEPYGEHMSLALGAVNRQVDPERTIVPVSGRLIRAYPAEYSDYMEAIVLQDVLRFRSVP